MRKPLKKPIHVFKPAKTTGDLIRAFRENFGISQDDMAYACKLSQANLSAIYPFRGKKSNLGKEP